MGIYIKGMEMPINCRHCPCADLEYYDCNLMPGTGISSGLKSGKRRDDCPLVPVPPHGRLIDADAYEALIRGLGNREYRRENGTICDAIKFLHPHYAPTIIPASEEGE